MSKSLSVVYLVRNEQDYIYKSIKSIESIADEIIIIDTGSIDRTIEICSAFNAKIYKYKWADDFSDARNFSLTKCTQDYILYLNADEIIDEGGCSKILGVLKNSQNSAYTFKIQDCLGAWEWGKFSELNKNYTKSSQIRMFPNDKNILFKGRVFESVEDSVFNSQNYLISNSDAIIYHHVFRGNPAKNRKIQETYYENLASGEMAKKEIKIMSDKKLKIEEEYIKEKCAIIIACFNMPSITKRCIDSVLASTSYPHRIIVVDNGSDERTLNYLKSIDNVELVEMGYNSGVSIARNAGMKRAMEMEDVSHICLLDNDTEVHNGWLTKLIGFINENPECGMVGPITTSATGSQCLVKNSWVGRYTYDQIIDLVGNRGQGDFQEANFLNRFCQVLKKDMVKEIGFLDEDFGLIGWEDQDYCRRMLAAGYKLHLLKSVFVFHKGHATCTYNKMPYFKLLQDAAKKYHSKWSPVGNRGGGYGQREKEKIQGTPYTSIVVLTYNNLSINKRFIEAIESYTKNYELIVVDNGSTDGTVKYLESLGDRIILIKNGKNLGIAKGRNIGLNNANFDYLICLDNDQIVRENWLALLHKEMINGFDFVGVEAWEFNNLYHPIKMHTQKIPGIKIDYVGAGGCLMKRSVLEDIGIYDERFSPAYYEDVEICMRAKEFGYKVGWCANHAINHLGNSTLLKSQKDFHYQDAWNHSNKALIDKMNRKASGEKFVETQLEVRKDELGCSELLRAELEARNTSENKLVTFCMCLKGRSKAARKSIESLVNAQTIMNFKFIIAEDHSNDLLDLSDFKFAGYVDHYVIDTGDSWNRSKTCNYAFKRASTQYICTWDADFLYPTDFTQKIMDLINSTNFNSFYLSIGCTETDSCNRRGSKFKKGDIYGGMYLYNRSMLNEINGYDETFINYGWEEVDANFRYERKHGVQRRRIEKPNVVFHDSHDESISGDLSCMGKNKSKMSAHTQGNINVVNGPSWGMSRLIDKKEYIMKDGYARFLAGKRVVIVGPAPSIVGSKQGELIENYDIVVRVNKALLMKVDMSEDIGKRTDILYNCMNNHPENGGPLPISLLKENNVKYVCCPYPRDVWFAQKDIIRFEGENKGQVPFHVIDSAYYKKIERSMGTRPNTGIVAILDLIKYSISELYITGFTFFKGGYAKGYRDKDEKGVMDYMAIHGNHKQEPQMNYMKEIFKNDGRITMDDALREVISN